MNELEQLRARLVELNNLKEQHHGENGDPFWSIDSPLWDEFENITDTLDLLDPCWEDEIPLTGTLKLYQDLRRSPGSIP
jgi:hypothetical protein